MLANPVSPLQGWRIYLHQTQGFTLGCSVSRLRRFNNFLSLTRMPFRVEPEMTSILRVGRKKRGQSRAFIVCTFRAAFRFFVPNLLSMIFYRSLGFSQWVLRQSLKCRAIFSLSLWDRKVHVDNFIRYCFNIRIASRQIQPGNRDLIQLKQDLLTA